jgi:hypothetical protein
MQASYNPPTTGTKDWPVASPLGPTPSQATVLRALQGMTIYGGTVDPVVVQQRRAANKRARKSRMINRRKKK